MMTTLSYPIVLIQAIIYTRYFIFIPSCMPCLVYLHFFYFPKSLSSWIWRLLLTNLSKVWLFDLRWGPEAPIKNGAIKCIDLPQPLLIKVMNSCKFAIIQVVQVSIYELISLIMLHTHSTSILVLLGHFALYRDIDYSTYEWLVIYFIKLCKSIRRSI